MQTNLQMVVLIIVVSTITLYFQYKLDMNEKQKEIDALSKITSYQSRY